MLHMLSSRHVQTTSYEDKIMLFSFSFSFSTAQEALTTQSLSLSGIFIIYVCAKGKQWKKKVTNLQP